MKAIGLIGEMSWQSFLDYYRLFNEAARPRLGGLPNALSLMYTIAFVEIENRQQSGQWAEAARRLERGGADLIALCANTMHKIADEIQASAHIPLLPAADATIQRIAARGLRRVGLLGRIDYGTGFP